MVFPHHSVEEAMVAKDPLNRFAGIEFLSELVKKMRHVSWEVLDFMPRSFSFGENLDFL